MQGVNLVDIGNFAVSAVNGISKTTTKGNGDFSSYLNSEKNNTVSNSSDVTNTKYNDISTANVRNEAVDSSVSGTDAKLNQQSDNGVVSDSEETVDLDAVSKAVTDEVKKVLEIDDETLNNAMAALGLVPVDLLDMSNLTKLVAFINGADVSDLLTNESMMLDFKEISEGIANIDWESLTGMTMEDFVSQLDAIMNDVSLITEDDVSLMPEDNVNDISLAEDLPTGNKVEVEYVVLSSKENNEDVSEDTNLLGGKADINQNQEVEKNLSSDGSLLNDEADNTSTGQMQSSKVSDLRGHEDVTNNQTGFIQNLNQAVNDAVQVTETRQADMQQTIDIVNQVVEKIKVTVGTDNTAMELQLNPESLGKVLLSVASKNGVMTASFTVQSDEARLALESQMYTLKENLESKNLKVEVVEVQIADTDFSQRNQTGSEDQKNPNNGNGKQMRYSFEEDNEEQSISDVESDDIRKNVMLDSGNSIDFTA